MRLRVDPAKLRDNLVERFREAGCLAIKEGTDLLDAQVLNSVSARHDRDVLDSCLRSWQEANPEARVEILSD